jgi:hypothetical protein
MPLHAQRADSAPPAPRWTAVATYLHLGARPIHRRAEPSMAVGVARTLGAGDPARAVQVEAGWLRASRVTTQAQGVTAGLSVGLPLGSGAAWDATAGPTLILRPGVAVLAGWAEAQSGEPSYSWRGLAGTPFEGQTGTESTLKPARGRTTGGGLSFAADLRLTRAIALTGSMQRWAFTGSVIRPNRQATLAGIGLAVHPGALARGARRGSHRAAGSATTERPAARRADPTVPAAPAVTSSADAHHTAPTAGVTR